MRVIVHDGSGQKLLGEGTYDEDVTVYAIIMPDGSIKSASNAEEKPTDIPEGGRLYTSRKNPKIKMDDGSIVYGCQVWWKAKE